MMVGASIVGSFSNPRMVVYYQFLYYTAENDFWWRLCLFSAAETIDANAATLKASVSNIHFAGVQKYAEGWSTLLVHYHAFSSRLKLWKILFARFCCWIN
jgi:hypothetical protein